ncbi:MAG: FTR1 family protein [Nanoarchaeota archaeon]|nr:FTR1 family protein [Nanoarchaeota archaeon]
MIESFLITSRETLEVSLVIGIVLSYLTKTDNTKYRKNVYYGVAGGVAFSILAAVLFSFFAEGFTGRAEALFEGITMLVGACLLTTMILWMMKQRKVVDTLHERVRYHLTSDSSFFSSFGIFFIIFIAVIREGVETVIFLNAAQYADGLHLFGGSIGVVVAIGVGWLFFKSTQHVNLKKMFSVSSVLLILFAAGLVAHGVHEFEEAGVVSGIISPLFDINPALHVDGGFPLLHESGVVGSFLKGLFGYNGNPSLLEVLAYLSYLSGIGIWYYRIHSRGVPQ